MSNLLPWLDGLSKQDKAILLRCLNDWYALAGTGEIHRGQLAFVPVEQARKALKRSSKRTAKALLEKIGVGVIGNDTVKVELFLDDVKVYKRFSPTPEKGRLLNVMAGWHNESEDMSGKLKWSPATTAGITLTRFGTRYIRREIAVNHVVTLEKKRPGLWILSVHKSCRDKAVNWIVGMCGIEKYPNNFAATRERPKKRRKRSRPRIDPNGYKKFGMSRTGQA